MPAIHLVIKDIQHFFSYLLVCCFCEKLTSWTDANNNKASLFEKEQKSCLNNFCIKCWRIYRNSSIGLTPVVHMFNNNLWNLLWETPLSGATSNIRNMHLITSFSTLRTFQSKNKHHFPNAVNILLTYLQWLGSSVSKLASYFMPYSLICGIP